jgi:DNA helicase HerA-like ATPase
VKIDSIYSVLFIQVDGYVENVDGKGRYMMIDLERGSYTSVHESLDDAVENLTSDDESNYDFSDSWEVFKGQNSDRLVSILDYNDTNFQEIENILLDYNINVENIWGLIR